MLVQLHHNLQCCQFHLFLLPNLAKIQLTLQALDAKYMILQQINLACSISEALRDRNFQFRNNLGVSRWFLGKKVGLGSAG